MVFLDKSQVIAYNKDLRYTNPFRKGRLLMKVAIIGSRHVDDRIDPAIVRYLPSATTEIVSGGAEGVDTAAARVARELGIPLRVFLPDYRSHGRQAPLLRNLEIVEYADEVLAFWDGQSKGTRHTMAACIRLGKPVRLIPLSIALPDR